MQLRDHVRDDDVDMAIKVMLDSFLQAQKISVRKMLQKSFHKYLSFGEETNYLLMHQLRSLISDAEKYKRVSATSISIE
jgi:DNA replication licensing factor MCM2